MNAGGRLVAYAAGVAVAFAGAFGIAAAVVPDSAAQSWQVAETGQHATSEQETEMQGHEGMTMPAVQAGNSALPGLSLSASGYALSPVAAPATPGVDGELSFTIFAPDGDALTEYATAHDKQLHLIVVRSDGQEFRHVHPTLDAQTGTWSVPWSWESAGTYRVYADFAPDVADAEGVTLTTTVHVAGEFAPVASVLARSAKADGFDVTLEGELVAGRPSELTVSIARDGAPVTTLEPYLGAFGHLVALREGDLAYLHVHADDGGPQAGEQAGPEVTFVAEAPTAGRYLLYLDFQVNGAVHTAAFVLDAAASSSIDGGGGDESHAH